MKTALLVIATGELYHRYARNLIASAEKFFVPHDTVVFTEMDPTTDPLRKRNLFKTVYQSDLGFPRATLMRYHIFLGSKELLETYDQLFYCDADMLFVAPVTEQEIFSSGITATEHPGYLGTSGTPERRLESTAFCPGVDRYYCGGFQGGSSKMYLEMAEILKVRIDEDDQRGIKAIWNDESHYNRYLRENPPAKILDPSFCYPENDPKDYYKGIWERAGRGPFEPKLLALDKI